MIALGDIVERCLRACGITKERVAAVTGVADCGCPKRQKALNEIGYQWQSRLGRYVRAVRYSAAVYRLYAAGRHLYLAFRVLFWGT
jgi:hypothetical protein